MPRYPMGITGLAERLHNFGRKASLVKKVPSPPIVAVDLLHRVNEDDLPGGRQTSFDVLGMHLGHPLDLLDLEDGKIHRGAIHEFFSPRLPFDEMADD